MKSVKKTAEYTVYQKRNNRYAVQDANKKWINGDEKVKILLAEDLVKVTAPSAKEEPEDEADPDAETDTATEATAESESPEENSDEEK